MIQRAAHPGAPSGTAALLPALGPLLLTMATACSCFKKFSSVLVASAAGALDRLLNIPLGPKRAALLLNAADGPAHRTTTVSQVLMNVHRRPCLASVLHVFVTFGITRLVSRATCWAKAS